jgi:hypothetical protein
VLVHFRIAAAPLELNHRQELVSLLPLASRAAAERRAARVRLGEAALPGLVAARLRFMGNYREL